MQIVNFLRDNEFGSTLLNGHRAIEEILLMDLSDAVALCRDAQDIFYVGRGPFYPVSLEGALKMKEISYIHAEGYAAGELKHGPFALLSKKTPVVAICMPGETYGVMSSNIKEMKARGTPIIALGEAGGFGTGRGCRCLYSLAKDASFFAGGNNSCRSAVSCLSYRSCVKP